MTSDRKFGGGLIALAATAAAACASAADPGDRERVSLARAAVAEHVAASGPAMLREFAQFLALPNVATNVDEMHANARWITRYVGERGFSTTTVKAGGAPYVLAQRIVSSSAPTILIYAHFDGQPVAPENWATPPFEPTLKDDGRPLDFDAALAGEIDRDWRIYARSAGDDKAPVIALMHAIDALERANVPAAVNIKLILDGEEEAGSPTLAAILSEHGATLDADLMLFCDGPMHQSGQRQLVFGVRGSATMDLTTYGPLRPLHSGHYGGWAPHPTDALVRLLASLKDPRGRIAVQGYYDDVEPISEGERAAIDAMPRIDETLASELALGRVEGDGERLEALVMQPAIIVKGFQAGGVGAQSRNIIVPQATASLNLRLVPRQTPEGVRAALERHFVRQGFHLVYDEEPDERTRREHAQVLRVDWRGGYRAYRSALDGPEAKRLRSLLAALDGQPPLLTPTMGGSLPIYLFEQALGIPIVILPVANHDNNQHGRDENLRIGNLFDAVAAYAAIIAAWPAP